MEFTKESKKLWKAKYMSVYMNTYDDSQFVLQLVNFLENVHTWDKQKQ